MNTAIDQSYLRRVWDYCVILADFVQFISHGCEVFKVKITDLESFLKYEDPEQIL